VARLLGARHLLQALMTSAAASSGESLGIGAAIDLAHAASMAGLAMADRRVRRLTLPDALIAPRSRPPACPWSPRLSAGSGRDRGRH
jgi:hypothetical protein